MGVLVTAMQDSRQRLLTALANTSLQMTCATGKEPEDLGQQRGDVSAMFEHWRGV